MTIAGWLVIVFLAYLLGFAIGRWDMDRKWLRAAAALRAREANAERGRRIYGPEDE